MQAFNRHVFLFLIVLFNSRVIEADIGDYLSGIQKYFGFKQERNNENEDKYLQYPQKIPYEVSTLDEKFISEASELTGVSLSELDKCQHRVVLKLQSDCNKMNDEELAKMAVHLLNCQSFVEGRRIYPCTEEMSIKDCTTNMDSDTWTSYHLMSNRVRAVCYTIRQIQFRGLAEQTVNRLMDTAKQQLLTLGKIANNQEKIKNIADDTFMELTKGHEELAKQQEDIQKAQLHGQLALEDNIRRLIDEKILIRETHNQLIQMTNEVQNKLESSAKLIKNQTGESQINHKELIGDLTAIQRMAKDIFSKIDQSSSMLIKQNEDFKKQYTATLKNLAEVNKTMHDLVNLVGGTREALEERLAWITTALGGTDLAVERLYLVLWHSGFILMAMLACAFLNARASTRLVVATLPPLNLILALHGDYYYLDPVEMSSAVAVFIAVQNLVIWAITLKPVITYALPWRPKKTVQEAGKITSTDHTETKDIDTQSVYQFKVNHARQITPKPELNGSTASTFMSSTSHYSRTKEHDETDDFNTDYSYLTPPASRNDNYSYLKSRSRSRSHTPLNLNTSDRGNCHAKTRLGTPCKLSSLPGRDYCYRHQKGDSVIG